MKRTTPPTLEASKASAKVSKLAAQLSMFSFLPDCALVPMPVVCAITGRSPTSIRRDVAAGRLARPVKVGPNCSRWRASDVRMLAHAL